MWTARPAGTARPVALWDYERLGRQRGLEYEGAHDISGNVCRSRAPVTIFSATAHWRPVSPKPAPEAVPTRQDSYYTLHMELQRRQPTFERVKWAVSSLTAELGRAPSEQDLCAFFPQSSRHLVLDMKILAENLLSCTDHLLQETSLSIQQDARDFLNLAAAGSADADADDDDDDAECARARALMLTMTLAIAMLMVLMMLVTIMIRIGDDDSDDTEYDDGDEDDDDDDEDDDEDEDDGGDDEDDNGVTFM